MSCKRHNEAKNEAKLKDTRMNTQIIINDNENHS